MERCNDEHFKKSSIRDEHHHRYQIAAALARGRVADCAAGIGYGGQIIETFGNIDTYTGIDPSAEAIEYALKHYKNAKRNYLVGSLEENALPGKSIDTFLMFETLEHTVAPAQALKGAAAKLADDGILIGSVPSREYELLCEEVYGVNPHHLHKFSIDDLSALLRDTFGSYKIFAAEFVLGTVLRPLSDQDGVTGNPAKVSGDLSLHEDTSNVANGSFYFFAGSKESVSDVLGRLGQQHKFLCGIPKVLEDFEEIKPLQLAFQTSEAMVRDRDTALQAQAAMIDDRDQALRAQTEMIVARDKAISAQEALLNERWALLVAAEEALAAEKHASRSAVENALQEQKRAVAECERKIGSMESLLSEKDALLCQKDDAIAEKEALILAKDEQFGQQARTLDLLHQRIRSRKSLVKQLFDVLTERRK